MHVYTLQTGKPQTVSQTVWTIAARRAALWDKTSGHCVFDGLPALGEDQLASGTTAAAATDGTDSASDASLKPRFVSTFCVYVKQKVK